MFCSRLQGPVRGAGGIGEDENRQGESNFEFMWVALGQDDIPSHDGSWDEVP